MKLVLIIQQKSAPNSTQEGDVLEVFVSRYTFNYKSMSFSQLAGQ